MGFAAYNLINDPNIGASETAGVNGTEIEGFTFFGPNNGAIMFFGNSQRINIHNNRFSGKQQSATSTINPRHGIVIDCGINPIINSNDFDYPNPASGGSLPTNFLIAMISIIKSGDTSTGHVVYTTFPPLSGYFNDSPTITNNSLGGIRAVYDRRSRDREKALPTGISGITMPEGIRRDGFTRRRRVFRFN